MISTMPFCDPGIDAMADMLLRSPALRADLALGCPGADWIRRANRIAHRDRITREVVTQLAIERAILKSNLQQQEEQSNA